MSSRPSLPGRPTLADRLGTGRGHVTHCWVSDGVSQELAGVVIRWRRVGSEWTALVAYVVDGTLRVSELPADRLRPASSEGSTR